MHVIATLGDGPTAAIAVVAILLGLLFAARGPRDKRLAGGDAQAGPTFVSLPLATAPDAEPGFVGPEGTIVGHGPIRLGQVGALGEAEAAPAADVPAWAAPPAEPVVEAEPAAPAQPAESGEAEAAFPGQPEAVEPAAVEPASTTSEAAEAGNVAPETAAPEAEDEEPGTAVPEAAEAEAGNADAAGAEPPAAEPEPEPAPSIEPAWRRYMHKPSVPFRHGGVKLGGKPPED